MIALLHSTTQQACSQRCTVPQIVQRLASSENKNLHHSLLNDADSYNVKDFRAI